MAHDQFKNTVTAPAFGFEASTPDVNFDPRPKGVYVGGTGDIAMHNPAGITVTWTNAQAGSILPVRPARILSVGTTATGLVLLY